MTDPERPGTAAKRCIYKELDAARLEMGLTQKELAERVGMCATTFRARCCGKSPFTDLERRKLSEITGITETRLFYTDRPVTERGARKAWVYPNLQQETLKAGVSYARMVKATGIAHSTLYHYLTGRMRMPMRHKQALHTALFPGVKFGWLFYLDEDLLRERMSESDLWLKKNEQEEVQLILTLLDALSRTPGRVRRPVLENVARMIRAALTEE